MRLPPLGQQLQQRTLNMKPLALAVMNHLLKDKERELDLTNIVQLWVQVRVRQEEKEEEEGIDPGN